MCILKNYEINYFKNIVNAHINNKKIFIKRNNKYIYK